MSVGKVFRSYFGFSFIVFMSVFTFAHAQWNVTSFGSGVMNNPFEVKVAKGRNDDTNRVYVSERNGRILEWTYSENGWSYDVVATGVINLALMVIGDARNDGTNRLYFTEYKTTGAFYECEWNGASWSKNKIYDTYQSLSLFMGDGRNDGRQRLYVGSMGDATRLLCKGLFEFTYTNGMWNCLQLHTNGMEGAGAVADIRNDGTNSVLANWSYLDEYRWDNSSYVSNEIDHSVSLHPDPVEVGDARNDGLIKAYVNSGQGKLEYTYSNGVWNKTILETTVQRGDVLVAKLKADGKQNVYVSHTSKTWTPKLPKGPVLEFGWDGQSSEYTNSIMLDAITGATAKLTAGNGRNDRVARLYTPDYGGGKILEVTSTDPWIYSVPSGELDLSKISLSGATLSLVLSNLTANCGYCVETAESLTGKWENAASFVAGTIVTNWSTTSSGNKAFYRVVGSPEQEPQ